MLFGLKKKNLLNSLAMFSPVSQLTEIDNLFKLDTIMGEDLGKTVPQAVVYFILFIPLGEKAGFARIQR